MSRYIDEEWLMKYFERGKDYKGEYVLDDLKYDAPTVEIIRCQECKYTDGEPPIADGRSWCVLHGSFMYYCSDGSRESEVEDVS